MASILRASGFACVESLHQFSERFLLFSLPLNGSLNCVWLCHIDVRNVPDPDDVDSDVPDICEYSELFELVKKTAAVDSPVAVLDVFDNIFKAFNANVTRYIFTQCHVLYNWGVNALELLTHQQQVQRQIEYLSKRLTRKSSQSKTEFSDFHRLRFAITKMNIKGSEKRPSADVREGSPDIFADEQDEKRRRRQPKKKYNFMRLQEIYRKYDRPLHELPKNNSDPTQEVFNLNKILYGGKQQPVWPKNHVLCNDSVDELVKHIIHMKVKTNMDVISELTEDSSRWTEFKSILRHFLCEHHKMNKNNGYGRILLRHLNSCPVATDGSRRLISIPKTVVSSYVADVLRKVLKLEFFGRNNYRKKVTEQMLRIVNGAKQENFIWYPVVRHLSEHKSELKWCTEMKDDFIRDRIIIKTIKWIIKEYIFVLLRNNFYVTETGSSDFGLRFYRKGDVESVSTLAVKDMLYLYQITPTCSNWKRSKPAIVREAKKKKMEKEEYQQPVAKVRFLPKSDRTDDVRPITYIPRRKTTFSSRGVTKGKGLKMSHERMRRRNTQLRHVKLLLELVVEKFGTGIKPLPNNPMLEIAWKKAVRLKETYGKLYFIKADISDAFGSVKHDKLKEILSHELSKACQEYVQLKRILEWRMTGGTVKVRTRFSFSDRPKENCILISRSSVLVKKQLPKLWVEDLKCVLKQVVFQQKLQINGRVFKMKNGLAQGSAGKFSSLLCEIYYSAMDRCYFHELVNSEDTILLRGVDDYLVLTTDLAKAEKFYKLVSGGIFYFNARFNRSKLMTNIKEDVGSVPYLGLIFNIHDMSVGPNYSKYQTKDLLSTMKLSDSSGDLHFQKTRWLERRALRIVCLKLYPILLNNAHNSLTQVRKIIFDACLMQANRVLVLTAYLFDNQTKNDLDICVVLHKSLKKITNAIMRSSLLVTEEDIKWLFYHASNIVFRKRSGQYKDLIVVLKYQLDLCELIFANKRESMYLELMKLDVGVQTPKSIES